MNEIEKVPEPIVMVKGSLDNLPRVSLRDDCCVRPIHSNEHHFLLKILYEAFPDENWTSQLMHQHLLDAEDVAATYVAAIDGVPVATASVRYLPQKYPGVGMIHWVGVLEARRGLGLGPAVCVRVLDHIRSDGFDRALIRTEPFRLPAIRMYEQLGFERER